MVRHLILVPFFLAYWGPDRYGEWITLTAIAAVLALCNFGVSAAAANGFVLHYAHGNQREAGKIMRAGKVLLLFTILVGCLVAFLGLFAAFYLGFLQMFSVPVSVSVPVILVVGVSGLIAFFVELNEAWFRAARKAHLAMNWEAGMYLTRITVTAGLLMAGQGMIAVAIADLLITLTGAGLMEIVGKRMLRDVSLLDGSPSMDDLKKLVQKGWAYVMTPVRRVIYIDGMTFVVRILGGPEMVVLFSTLRTFTNSIVNAFTLVNASILPEFQIAFGAGRKKMARQIFYLSFGVICFIALGGVISMLILGPWLYGLWTGGVLIVNQSTWILSLIAVGICATSCTAAEVLRWTNRPELLAIAGVLAASLAVVVAFFTITLLGVDGAFVGLIVMEVVMAACALPAACRILDQPVHRLPADLLNLVCGGWKSR